MMKETMQKTCKILSCDRPSRSLGWCHAHYNRWRSTGVEPTTPAKVHERHGHARGHAQSPTLGTWKAMIARCTNPKRKEFALYGARGITVCDRWRNSFSAFLADMGERPAGMTIDRIDNMRGYEPDNCCWATRSQQQRNMRSNVLTIELVLDLRRSVAAGERFSIWADRHGIHVDTARSAAKGLTWRDIEVAA